MRKQSKTRRIVVISDLHCGHQIGITHPDFDAQPSNTRSAAYKLYKRRRQCWSFYAKKLQELQPVEYLIVNGDCIDGDGAKSGGTELLTTDREEQVEMAVAVIESVQAAKIVMSYGTPYHAGTSEDWENLVAKHKRLDGLVHKIGSHDVLEPVDTGLRLDYKHYISSSSIPHGRFTALARSQLWNVLWAERDEYPLADIVIRSHVHAHVHCGTLDWFGIITPALQAYGSKFGARRPDGTVDFGFIHFDVKDRNEWSWHPHILRFKAQKWDHLVRI